MLNFEPELTRPTLLPVTEYLVSGFRRLGPADKTSYPFLQTICCPGPVDISHLKVTSSPSMAVTLSVVFVSSPPISVTLNKVKLTWELITLTRDKVLTIVLILNP